MEFALLELHHRDLERLFASHQYAVVEHEFAEAVVRLDRFSGALHRHVRDEDELVLPLYRVTVGSQPGATLELFEAEHRKIERLFARILAETSRLPTDPSPQRIIALLEQETHFKGLLEHHFQREENLLFPAMDAAVPGPERVRVLTQCALRAIIERLPARAPSKSMRRMS